MPMRGETSWLVETGALDVFYAREDASGEPAGALRHVLRVQAGQAAFGVPHDERRGASLFAAASPGSLLRPFEAGDLGRDLEASLEAAWRSQVNSALGGIETGRVSLERFQAHLLEHLARAHREEQDAEAERLSVRQQADDAIVHRALHRLAAPLSQGNRTKPSAAASTLPLAEACEAIGKVSGIKLKVPPSVLRGQAKDPQRAIARYSAVRIRKVILEEGWWTQDSGPLLAYLEADNQPVALLPHGRNRYLLFNPADQTTVRVTAEVSRKLSGVAHMFYRPFPNKPLRWKDLLLIGLHGCGRDIAAIITATLLASLLALVTPWATSIVFDSIVPGAERNRLGQTVLLIVACAVTATFVSIARGYALLRVEGKMDFATQAAVWDRLLNLPVAFFRSFSAGDLAYRSMAVSQIRAIVTGSTLTSILSGAFSLSSISLLLYYSPRLAATAILLAFIGLVVIVSAGLLQLRFQRQVNENVGNLAGMVFEFIGGISKFRVSGSEGRAFARWAAAFSVQKQINLKIRKVSGLVAVFQSAFPVVSMGVIFYTVADIMAQSGKSLSTGSFMAFEAAFMQLLYSMLGLGSGLLTLLNAIPIYERARPILDAIPEVTAHKADPGELKGGMEISHVSFRYGHDGPLVLQDVSLSIHPGAFVAIVGASGSGKSTLMRLLLGFERPSGGSIYYDGQDLSGLDLQEVRRQMGIVLQNGKLMASDILGNIIGAAPLTVDDAWEAARIAGIEEDIKGLPMGMYTTVTEGGRLLSGGQRQRLMIARAVVGKPRILLFDEATSALDNRTQAIVSEALEQMNATRIVIAHRLSTVMKADMIVVMDQGRLMETGTYGELMARGGIFAALAARQLT